MPEILANAACESRLARGVGRAPRRAGDGDRGLPRRLPGRCELRRPVFFLGALLPAAATGCEEASHVQSALHPAGQAAAWIAWLWWILFWVCTTVFVFVLILTAIAIWRRSRQPNPSPPFGATTFIVLGGIVVPTIVLLVLLVLTLQTSAALDPPQDVLTIQVIGNQFWWGVRYPEQDIITANEITIPAGRPVRLELTSADVIHSFWVPRLNGKMDLIPGNLNIFWIEADHPGVFRGQCAEFCGVQHAHMAFAVVALPPEEFDAWVRDRQQVNTMPEDPVLQAGLRVFLAEGCSSCHTIEGTPAHGKVGPDLTHLGSRGTIGAGILPNTFGNLAGWIGNPQALKPGIKMPRSYLTPNDLHAVTRYLQSLE